MTITLELTEAEAAAVQVGLVGVIHGDWTCDRRRGDASRVALRLLALRDEEEGRRS